MKQNLVTIGLNPDHIERLTALAKEHGTLSRSGPTTGQPALSALIRAIGDGSLRIAAPGKKWEGGKRVKRRKPWKGHSLFPPKWWKPNDMFEMKTDAAVGASGLTKEQLVAGGMELLNNDIVIIPSIKWTGWFKVKEEEE